MNGMHLREKLGQETSANSFGLYPLSHIVNTNKIPAIICYVVFIAFSDVNKDLNLKAKARTKDQTLKAKDRTKDQTLKAKDRTKDLSFKAKAKDQGL